MDNTNDINSSNTIVNEVTEIKSVELTESSTLLTDENTAQKINSQNANDILINLIINIIQNDETIKKYNIILDKKTVDVISLVIKSNPQIFGKISDTLKNILNDGKINSKDIPEILNLIKEIYEIIYNIKVNKITKNNIVDITSDILKFLVHLLVQDDIIKVHDKDEFIKEIFVLIDTTMTLIKLTKTLKTPKCHFYKLFNKK